MEKYHKVEKENNMITIKKMIKNFVEKLRNLALILLSVINLTFFRQMNLN